MFMFPEFEMENWRPTCYSDKHRTEALQPGVKDEENWWDHQIRTISKMLEQQQGQLVMIIDVKYHN